MTQSFIYIGVILLWCGWLIRADEQAALISQSQLARHTVRTNREKIF